MALGRVGILIATSPSDAEVACSPGEWSITSAPAVATVATVTRAAVAGVSHVFRSVVASCTDTTAPRLCVVRDGLSGVGAILWQAYVAGAIPIFMTDLNIIGTAGNAMTIEYTTAPAAGSFEAVSLTGYDAS